MNVLERMMAVDISTRLEKTNEHQKPAGQASPTTTPVCPAGSPPPSSACPNCTGGNLWLDPYGNWHCEICSPPKIPAAVRARHVVSIQHADGLEAREDLGAIFGPSVDLGDGRGAWREFLRPRDGITGIVQVGNERAGMAVIDAFDGNDAWDCSTGEVVELASTECGGGK